MLSHTAQTPRTYAGPFAPLPDDIRAQHPDMFAWEHHKSYPTPDRWEVAGWTVFAPGGAMTYALDGCMIRDRVLYD